MRRRAVRARSCAAAAQLEGRGDAFPRGPTIPGIGDDHCPSRRRNHRRWADSRSGQHPGHRSPVRILRARRLRGAVAAARRRARGSRRISRGCRRSSPTNVDTSEYAKEAPYKVCFSNAGVNNPWRVVGWTTMQAEVEQHPEITEFVHVDAEGSDEKQIADIQDLLGQNCTHPDRLTEHDRRAHTRRRAGVRAVAGGRLRPRSQHRLPGDLHPSDRWICLRR